MHRDSVTLEDLIAAYLRFKEWMDYDPERSAYSAMEIIVLQKLFGTPYVVVPNSLAGSSYSELLNAMENRLALIDELLDAIYYPTGDGKYELVLREMDKTTFRSTVHYFMTLHEALFQMSDSVVLDKSGELLSIDDEPMEDHFDNSDVLFEEVRQFMLSENPELAAASFPREKLYALGLPRQAPPPIDHGPPGLNS